MPGDRGRRRQPRRAADAMVGVEAARLEIVVAGDDPQRQAQPVERRAHQAVLLRRAVVGVVAGQEGEVERAREVPRLVHDPLQREAPVRVRGVHVQVADVEPGQRCPVRVRVWFGQGGLHGLAAALMRCR